MQACDACRLQAQASSASSKRKRKNEEASLFFVGSTRLVRLWTEDPFSEIHFIRYRSIGYTLHSSTSEQGTGAKDDLIFDCSIFGVRILTPMRTDGSTVLEIGINVKVTGAL